MVSKDFDRLAEYIAENLGDDHTFIVDTVLRGTVLNLVEDGDHYRAAQVVRWWSEWLSDVGAVETKPMKVEHSTGADIGGGRDDETAAMIEYMTRDAGGEATDVSSAGNGGMQFDKHPNS